MDAPADVDAVEVPGEAGASAAAGSSAEESAAAAASSAMCRPGGERVIKLFTLKELERERETADEQWT